MNDSVRKKSLLLVESYNLTNEEVENLLHSTKGSGLKSIQSRVNNLKQQFFYQMANHDEAKISVKIPLDEIKN